MRNGFRPHQATEKIPISLIDSTLPFNLCRKNGMKQGLIQLTLN